MGSISMPQGRGNRMHNIRSYGEGKMPSNIDVSKTKDNIILVDETLNHAYHRLFDEAVEEYNAKQRRLDRKIKDYYQHIKNSKNGEKLFYEDVLQWGKKDDFEMHPELRMVARECLLDYINGSEEKGIPSFQERNPGLELIGAYIHMDEASPHMHFDYVPVAIGYKNGMQKRNSLDRTMKALILKRIGKEYSPRASEKNAAGKCTDNATKQWKEMERSVFRNICMSRGLLVDEENATPERDSLSVLEYKSEMRKKELKSLEDKAEELKGDILSAEQIYNIDIQKPLVSQKVKIGYLELMSLKKTAEHIDEVEADAKKTTEEARLMVEQANARANEGIKEANARANIAIAKANAIKKEAEEIIAERDSIIKSAMDKAQRIIQDAIDSATSKAKEALESIKLKVKTLTSKKNELESEVKEMTGLGDAIIAEKKKEAASVMSNAKKKADAIIDDAIKNSGKEDIAQEIDRRLGIISMKEVADAKKKVLTSYEVFRHFDKDGSVAKSIDEDRMDLIDEWHKKATVYGPNKEVKKWEPWHDEIEELYSNMKKYLELKKSPHSREEVLRDIQATLSYQVRGYRR